MDAAGDGRGGRITGKRGREASVQPHFLVYASRALCNLCPVDAISRATSFGLFRPALN